MLPEPELEPPPKPYMPPMLDWFAYTSMAATEGSAFCATASASVWSDSASVALMLPEFCEPSCVDEPESEPPPLSAPVAACQMPKPPSPMTQASAAPANASRNVRRPCDFFSTVTWPGVCCAWYGCW